MDQSDEVDELEESSSTELDSPSLCEAGGVQRRSFTLTMVLREEVRVVETYVRVVQDGYDKETG